MTKRVVIGSAIAFALIVFTSLMVIPAPKTALKGAFAKEVSTIVSSKMEKLMADAAKRIEIGKEYQLISDDGRFLSLDVSGRLCLSDQEMSPLTIWHFEKDAEHNWKLTMCSSDGRKAAFQEQSENFPSAEFGIGNDGGTVAFLPYGENIAIVAPENPRISVSYKEDEIITTSSQEISNCFHLIDVTEMKGHIAEEATTNMHAMIYGEISISPASQDFLCDSEKTPVTTPLKTTRSATWTATDCGEGLFELSNLESDHILCISSSFPNSLDVELVTREECQTLDPNSYRWFVCPASEGTVKILSSAWTGLYLTWEEDRLSVTRDEVSATEWEIASNTLYDRQEQSGNSIAQIAQREYETGPHKGGEKYWSLFSSKYEAWCSEFGGWCLHEAGLELGVTMPKKCSGARQIYDFYKNHPEYAEVRSAEGNARPRTGDICLYNDSSGTPAHTNVCVEVQDGCFYAVSGNCGDKVKRLHKDFGFSGYYITINWEAALTA